MFKDFYEFYDTLASKGEYGDGRQVALEAFERFSECQAILDFLEKNKDKEFSAKEIAKNLEIKYGKWSFTTHSVAAHCVKLIQMGKIHFRNEWYQIKILLNHLPNGNPRYELKDTCTKYYRI